MGLPAAAPSMPRISRAAALTSTTMPAASRAMNPEVRLRVSVDVSSSQLVRAQALALVQLLELPRLLLHRLDRAPESVDQIARLVDARLPVRRGPSRRRASARSAAARAAGRGTGARGPGPRRPCRWRWSCARGAARWRARSRRTRSSPFPHSSRVAAGWCRGRRIPRARCRGRSRRDRARERVARAAARRFPESRRRAAGR